MTGGCWRLLATLATLAAVASFAYDANDEEDGTHLIQLTLIVINRLCLS